MTWSKQDRWNLQNKKTKITIKPEWVSLRICLYLNSQDSLIYLQYDTYSTIYGTELIIVIICIHFISSKYTVIKYFVTFQNDKKEAFLFILVLSLLGGKLEELRFIDRHYTKK